MDNEKIIDVLQSIGRRIAVENLAYAIGQPKGYKYKMKAFEHVMDIINDYIKILKEENEENGKN